MTSTGIRNPMSLRQHTPNELLPTASEQRGAANVLGERHPLTRALARNRTGARQAGGAGAGAAARGGGRAAAGAAPRARARRGGRRRGPPRAPAGAVATVAHLALGPVVTAATALVVLAFAV